MATLSRLLHATLLLAIAVLAGMPWGLPTGLGPAMAMITAAAVFYWSWRSDAGINPPVIFVAGLIIDILSGGPIGYWAFLLLIAHGAAIKLDQPGRVVWLRSWLLFALTAIALCAIAWTITTVYQMRPSAPWPLLAGAAIGVAAYPVTSALLAILDRLFGLTGYARTSARW